MVKRILFLLTILPLIARSMFGAIVNNSTVSPSSEDSISFQFCSLDSLGNPTTADSMYILVTGPNGNIAFRDSMTSSSSRITSTVIRGKQFYSYANQVSNLDSSGAIGVYSVTLLAKKNTGNLLTPCNHSFQIISEEFSDQLALIGDSTFVKGGIIDSNKTEMGGSGDSASIANWVWNTPHINHTTGGTFGRYLDSEISGVGGGSGAYAVTILAWDSTIDQVVSGVGLAVRNINQTSLLAVGRTGVDGQAAFNLDADSMVVIASAPGYVFDGCDTIVIVGPGTDTMFCYQFDPGTPSTPKLCRVYGNMWDVNGQPESNVTISASLPSGVTRYGLAIITASLVTTTTDLLGYFSLDLCPSDSLVPAGTEYEISFSRPDGSILRERVLIPDSVSWRMTW